MLEATTIGAIVRAALQIAAGAFGLDGIADGESIQTAASALVALGTVVWSLWQKKQAKK
jgi:membrane protein DedA with SNARE-associated domain